MTFLSSFFLALGLSFFIGFIGAIIRSFDERFFMGVICTIIVQTLVVYLFVPSVPSNEPYDWGMFFGSVGLFAGYYTGEEFFQRAFKHTNKRVKN